MKEIKCKNCHFCRNLWWWTYKEDGLPDNKNYSYCCLLFANDDDGSVMKIDDVDSFCECFLERRDGKDD